MPWNGSGAFNRIYSWVADAAAGLDISSSRMDTDTDDITSNGFGNCITRDGQGQPTADLPMAGFRHTGVQNAVNRTDYGSLGQVQDGLINWTIAGGSSDALTATFTPALTALSDGQLFFVRASAANATTTPTFAPNGLGPFTITKNGGQPLVASDIPGDNAECVFRYNATSGDVELLNPANISVLTAIAQTGTVWMTLASSAPSGWLMFDDTTMGSAGSGSVHASAANQALFTILFNNVSDTNCPIQTSTGGSTTRAGQGTAAAAWANNCRMALPKVLGRALGVAGSGSGLTTRALAATVGAETDALSSTSQLPQFTPSGTVTANLPALISGVTAFAINVGAGPINIGGAGSGGTELSLASVGVPASFAGAAIGSASPSSFSIMQPSTFFNAIVKQ